MESKDTTKTISAPELQNGNLDKIKAQKQEIKTSTTNDKKGLATITKISYGFGNILNDACATLWFTYLLVYLNYVAQLNNVLTGYLMLVGQVSDAFGTILFGFLTDKLCGSNSFTRRKIWHLMGCIAVFCFFPFLFNSCFICTSESSSESKDWLRFAYYFVFIVLFQFGWAMNQVAHLAVIPELATKHSDRVGLSSVRHAFTVLSSVAVYGIAFLLIGQSDNSEEELRPSDQSIFTILSATSVGAGLVFTVIFHCVISRTTDDHSASNTTTKKVEEIQPKLIEEKKSNGDMAWSYWFKEHQFYQVGTIYTASRVIIVCTQVYIPFYVSSTLHMKREFIAIIPLISYASSFVTAIIMKHINKLLGRKITYCIGGGIVLISCVWMWFITENSAYQVIGAAILLGIGTSTIYVTSLALIADVIGEHTATGGFVYGSISFSEKLINGGVVLLIQYFYPCMSAVCCEACEMFYRYVVAFVPAGATVVALLVLVSLLPMNVGKLRYIKDSKSDKNELSITI